MSLDESINEALIACVKACGGSKQVAPKLWPEKTPDAAQRLLLDCLNEDRPAHLTPEQMVLVFREARARGCHAGMAFLAHSLGYAEPVPIDPRDELMEATRKNNELLEAVLRSTEELKRLHHAVGPRQQIKAVA